MNNWSLVGYIFIGFALVLLLVGLTLRVMATSAPIIGMTGMAQSIFMSVFLPYGIGATLCFIIGFAGVSAGAQPIKFSTSLILSAADARAKYEEEKYEEYSQSRRRSQPDSRTSTTAKCSRKKC
jgi:hypothetical protein